MVSRFWFLLLGVLALITSVACVSNVVGDDGGAGDDGVCEAGSPGCESTTPVKKKASAVSTAAADKEANRHIERGQKASQQKDYETALQHFEAAFAIQGTSLQVKCQSDTNAGLSMRSLLRSKEALERLSNILQNYPPEIVEPNLFYLRLGIANALQDTNDFVVAEVYYQSLLEMPQFSNPGVQISVLVSYATSLITAVKEGKDTDPLFNGRDLLKDAEKHLKKLLDDFEGKAPADVTIKLADVLVQRGQRKQQKKLLKRAVKNGLFRVPHQYPRSFNWDVPQPTSPWWTDHDRLPIIEEVREQWKTLRDEFDKIQESKQLSTVGERVAVDAFIYNAKAGGVWQEHVVFASGREFPNGPELAPKTAKLFRHESKAMLRTPSGQVAFSVVAPKTKISPHCGPTNEMLTCHLGIRIPAGGLNKVGISVAGEKRGWKDGEVFCFEDSFEHEVWNNSDEWRVVFIFNVLHPKLW